MVIMGKRKGRATKANALMESIRQRVGSASSSSYPNAMPAETVPQGAPPLIVWRPTVDSCSTGSQSASVTAPETATAPKSTRRIVGSARIKVRSQTGPSVRGINSLVAHDIGCGIRSLVGMRASTFYDLDQTEKWKVWNAMSRLSLANKRNRGEKTMHHHTGSSLIIYTMEELRIQGEQLPIIKGFEKTYVRAGDEDMTKKYNDMVDEVNKQKDAFKEQHPDVTEEQIMEN
ncbi:hypothetical protein ACLB2K_045228 [Fragaria x ananassa]